jgi:hypothetical protein
MKSIDKHGDARRTWLRIEQGLAVPKMRKPTEQSDFESSAVWRCTFVAAFIVTVINIPVSPPPVQPHAPVRATV